MASKESVTRMRRKVVHSKKALLAPVRLPGLNFDTFEAGGGPMYEAAHGTDRAPTYQSRRAATFPRQYVQRLLSWMAGRPRKAYTARRARLVAERRYAKTIHRRHPIRQKQRASASPLRAMH